MQWWALSAAQIINIVSSTNSQSMLKQAPLQWRCSLHAFFYARIHLLPEPRNRRHARGMRLPHRVLYLVRIGVDDDVCTLRECQVGPSTLKNVRVWQETNYPVFLANGHTFVISFQCGMVLAVSKHHTLTIARCSAGVKYVTKVVVVGIGPSPFHFALPWQVFAQLQKIVEVQGVGVVGADAYVAVEHHNAFQRVTKCEHAVGLIILFLFANEDKTHLRIVHNKLHLLLTTGCIERHSNGANAIRAEVGIEILQTILREYGDILLRFHTQVEQSIAHLLHAQ